MKIYLLILLIGLITSKFCGLYTHLRVKGALVGNSCVCPSSTKGLIGLVDPDMKKFGCYCYQRSMISECKADSQCRFDNFVGCYKY